MAKGKTKNYSAKDIDRAYNQPETVETDIDNPFFNRGHKESRSNPRRVKGMLNVKAGYVIQLYAQGLISAAEKMAAEKMANAFHMSGGNGAPGMDYEKTPVDGGSPKEPISERVVLGVQILTQAKIALGPKGYSLAYGIVCHGLKPSDIETDRAAREYTSKRFRECLDTLAIEWGYKARQPRSA